MKAIAEYFRDLAAEDRYFGAEPPQPDAAMLHKIAEREIQRRVEAKVQENGVILRAEDSGALAAPVAATAPVAAPEAQPQPVVEMPARGSVAAQPRPAPTLAPPDAEGEPTAEAGTETVAERLSRMRRAAAQNQTPAQTASVLTAATAPSAAAEAQAIATETSDDENADLTFVSDDFADLSDTAGDLAPDTPVADADAHSGATAAQALEAEEPAAPVEDIPDADAIDADDQADLAALDGVADLGEAAAEPDAEQAAETAAKPADDAELTFEDDFEDADDLVLASLASDLTPAAFAPSATPAPVEAQQPAVMDEADDAALLASLGALVDPEDELVDQAEAPVVANEEHQTAQDDVPLAAAMADDDTPYVAPETEAVEAEAAPVQEFVAEDLQSDDTQTDAPAPVVEATFAEPEPEAIPEEATTPDASAPVAPVRPVRPVRSLRPTAPERPSVPADLVAELSNDTPTNDTMAETESRTPITVEKLQRARARVIKIRRSDAPAAPAQPEAAVEATSLSQEAEAALAAELASLEQDLTATPAPAPAATVTPSRPTARSDAAAEHRLERKTEEVAVNRLMAEASTQMEVPDTKRRQSAIAHLKAAVAATIAERRATGSTLAGNGSERLGAYRDDLAKVVRPDTSAGVVQAERPAPLVLVSEQRIDRSQSAPVQPVRPQRPAAPAALTAEADLEDELDADDDAGNIFDASSGFPDFAERLGATDLPALLEAAAAYIACVEGRDSFTRPQLMRHLGAAAEGVSREDGLRSFGTLLRDGVIERSRRGQFAINEASPLLAEARKIAG